MKGLDLHRAFFEECGRPLLVRAFPEEFPLIAVASVGFGSDRLGADDEYSRDHCWEPGFQILSDRLPREILKRVEDHLCENLPWEFRGIQRSDTPGSNNAIRAWTVDEFFESITSFTRPPARDRDWLLITDEALCTVTNGEVFYDPTGDFTRRREAFGYYPENVWRFKLAGRAHHMDVHRYELERLIAHGEEIAATLVLWQGLREVFHFVFLVNRRYAPYDRWLHWAFRRLPVLASETDSHVTGIFHATDIRERLSLYAQIGARCADWSYAHGLADRGKPGEGTFPSEPPLWFNLRKAVQGELTDFPVVGWTGVEYRYGSQFAIGDFRELLGG